MRSLLHSKLGASAQYRGKGGDLQQIQSANIYEYYSYKDRQLADAKASPEFH